MIIILDDNYLYDIRPESNQVEVHFTESGFGHLLQTNLNKNTFFGLFRDFTCGDISNIDIDIKIDPTKNIRIWTSRSSIHDYLGFLYFCYKFKCENISVVFVDDYDKNMQTLGQAGNDEIDELLKHEKKLTTTEINQYKEEWLKLVKENSELRLFKDKKVISVDYDYLNDYIEEHYNSSDNKNMWRIIGSLMADDTENYLSDITYKFLLERFISKQ